MAAVEASGKTVDEAIESALEELDAELEDVEYEVLEEPKKGGLLGVGGHQARVRVWRAGEDPEEAAESTKAPRKAADGDDDDDDEDEHVEDEAEFAAQMLDQMMALMGIEGDVSIRDAETPGDGLGMAKAVLEIEGDDLGVLIGRRGETLTGLQYVLNLMVSRQLGEGNYFTVDIEGYRRRRERQLRQLAQKMSDQVRRTRKTVTLEPMPANERRIIHLTLSEDQYVSTDSIGEGEDRKVTITPR
jgi:spoIIIJ-associated protein